MLVVGHNLFLIKLVDPHGAGVVHLVSQATSKNSNHVWTISSDSQNSVGGERAQQNLQS